jgi:hypothetical protein
MAVCGPEIANPVNDNGGTRHQQDLLPSFLKIFHLLELRIDYIAPEARLKLSVVKCK